ncbi:molybdopterin molybdenumtransferase MoeA [Leucothrix sargassi]|nr:molybdopterin molybdenumtransferase MoeA [Leucothrix sargassi]
MSQVSCYSPSLGIKLLSVEEALSALKALATPVTLTETVSLSDGLQRVLAEDVYSTINVPPLDNSAMDGYALKADEFKNISEGAIKISQRIPAGSVGSMLESGTVARIFTGAPIPEGADAVVMQELCTVSDDESEVIIKDNVTVGQNIRSAGEDIAEGDCVLKTGHLLQAQDLGLLASIGCASISVVRRLKVAVLFTGDELRQPGTELGVGQIYNSNQYTLVGLLERLGCEVLNFGIVEDTLDSTVTALEQAAKEADLVVTSGGVSVGEEDHVKAAVASLGELELWRIAVKPGKPFAFGQISGVPFLGLPGNPVSVFVTACVFARPYIRAMQGLGFEPVKGIKVAANFDISFEARRQEYLRVKLVHDDQGEAALELYPHQGSGVLTSASWATGLAVLKQGDTITAGEKIEYVPFSFLYN